MTTGRINQVFTKVTVQRQRHGIHAHKPPATRYNFSDHRRRDEGCQMTAGPGEHPQTAHNQATGDSKDHPCPQKRARTKFTQEGKKSFKVPRNSARKSKFASPGGPRHRTGGRHVIGTARPHNYTTKATRNDSETAQERGDGKTDGAHTQILQKRRVTMIIFKTTRVDFTLGVAGLAGPFLKPPGGKTHPSTAAPPYLREFLFRTSGAHSGCMF